MVADSRHREKTFKIEKNFHNREKTFRIEKKVLESRKIFQNRENYFKIEQNVSESRNILLLESRKNLEFNEPSS